MKKKIALLHTSLVFIQREALVFQLFQELLPEAELINIIEDKMLKQVTDTGVITPDLIRRMCYYALAAEAMGADAIFNTCSSLGPAADVARKLVKIPLVKIDEGMAEVAAREGNRIGVLATVPTTLKPTVNLLHEKAEAVNRRIETREALAAGAFDLLMNGQTEAHDACVVEKAQEASGWADMLVLAQCSMARIAPRLEKETGLPVLSSPRLGIERLKQVLEQAG